MRDATKEERQSINNYIKNNSIKTGININEVKEPTKEFKEIIVSYPNPDICTYPEYKGKPYFGIKYIKNGEECIGYGTYNPQVLSEYIREFINSK